MSAVSIVIPLMVAVSGYKSALKDEAKRLETNRAEQGRTYTYSLLVLCALFLSFIPRFMGFPELVGALVESVATYTALYVAVRGCAVYMQYKRLPKDASLLFTLFCAAYAAMEFIARFYSMTRSVTIPDWVSYSCLAMIALVPFFCIGEMISVKRSKKVAK